MAKRKPRLSEINKLKLKSSTQAKSITQLCEVYSDASIEIESLKSKISAYMESASMYKGENEDLRVRCEEVEEMLRQKEASLEIEYMSHTEEVKKANELEGRVKLLEKENEELKVEVSTQKMLTKKQEEMKSLYFNSLDKAKKRINELEEMYELSEESREDYLNMWQNEKNKPWWKKVFTRG